MVQRYDLAALGTSAHPDNEGHFVKYEDYAELLQTLAATRAHVAFAARQGDAHAVGLLRAIDKVVKK